MSLNWALSKRHVGAKYSLKMADKISDWIQLIFSPTDNVDLSLDISFFIVIPKLVRLMSFPNSWSHLIEGHERDLNEGHERDLNEGHEREFVVTNW